MFSPATSGLTGEQHVWPISAKIHDCTRWHSYWFYSLLFIGVKTLLLTSREPLKNLKRLVTSSIASRLPRTDSKVLPCNHGHWPKNGRSSSAAPIKSASGWCGGAWATLGLGKLAGMAFKCVSKTRMLRETPGASWPQSYKRELLQIAGKPRRFFKSSFPSTMKTESVYLVFHCGCFEPKVAAVN